jgi:hypothetical protein
MRFDIHIDTERKVIRVSTVDELLALREAMEDASYRLILGGVQQVQPTHAARFPSDTKPEGPIA